MNTGRIRRVSNWGYWFELDGKPIKNGETLVITTPAGKLFIVARVERGEFHYSDHGHPGIGPDDKVYYDATTTDGVATRVYLTDGQEARRVT